MKKVFIYLLVVFSPLVLSLVGCSDDDYTSNSIVGLWEMTGYRNGWIPLQIVEEGDIVVDFTKDGKVKTLGIRGNLFTFLSRPTYISKFLSKFAENVRPEDAKWITSADSSRVYPTDDSELTTKSPLI